MSLEAKRSNPERSSRRLHQHRQSAEGEDDAKPQLNRSFFLNGFTVWAQTRVSGGFFKTDKCLLFKIFWIHSKKKKNKKRQTFSFTWGNTAISSKVVYQIYMFYLMLSDFLKSRSGKNDRNKKNVMSRFVSYMGSSLTDWKLNPSSENIGNVIFFFCL